MGAESFSTIATGKTAIEAFDAAVKQAQYDYGHAGYTGTIAEKDDFLMLNPPEEVRQQMRDNEGWFEYRPDCPLWSKVDDKWGPAGCVALGDDQYAFFGWASS